MSKLSKRELKRLAYEMIFKEGKSHQQTFDELRPKSAIDLGDLAVIVEKVPSKRRLREQNVLNFIYIGLLGVVIILRGLALLGIGISGDIDSGLIMLIIFAALIVPGMGIVGALTGKVEMYYATGFLLILTLIRTLANVNFSHDLVNYIFFAPVVAAAIIAFYLPSRLKTPFKKIIEKHEVDGRVKKFPVYRFESSTHLSDDDLLDN